MKIRFPLILRSGSSCPLSVSIAWMLALVFGPFCVTHGQTPVALQSSSYGELAHEMLCAPLDEIEAGLSQFTVATLPHEAKALRKLLGKYRNRLDLFAFAYPDGPGTDLFLRFREDVDKGYERMGDFKDLFDAQRIDLAEFDPIHQEWSQGIRPEAVTYPSLYRVSSRREKVLKWKVKFMRPDRLAVYRSYICNPDLDKFHNRSTEDLSRFFWGTEPGLRPRLDLSGVDNFRWLAAELLSRALRDYDAVQALTDLEGPAAEVFHDFRKRVRAVVKIAIDVSLHPDKSKKAEKLHDLMDDLDDSYGDINDLILDLELALSSGRFVKATSLRAEIASDWSDLQRWQMTKRVTEKMAEYAALLNSWIRDPKGSNPETIE